MSKKILVVEDTEDNRQILRDLIHRHLAVTELKHPIHGGVEDFIFCKIVHRHFILERNWNTVFEF